jgi:hypothetical protein
VQTQEADIDLQISQTAHGSGLTSFSHPLSSHVLHVRLTQSIHVGLLRSCNDDMLPRGTEPALSCHNSFRFKFCAMNKCECLSDYRIVQATESTGTA